jgi:hypothetical protein
MAVSQSLSVTEVSGSVNTSANTSKVRILWKSTQTGESHNDYTKTAKYYVSINGGAETEYSVSYTLPQNTTKTIVDTTITVTHKTDGSGTVSVRTWMDTGISAGVVQKSKTLGLTTIPRASTITLAYAITLGNKCKIMFTPASSSFWYKLVFSVGTWSDTTAAFRPGTTSPYTYTGCTIPLDVARQFPNDPSGTVTATLYTFESENAQARIGSTSSKDFTVTLPENASTKPSVKMTLTPETPYAKFASLYLQGRSKVKATFVNEGKYGASISTYGIQVEGESYDTSPYTSDILRKSGNVSITGKATDSRGFSNTVPGSINVIAYEAPYIAPSEGNKKVICERCTEDGIASERGTYLHVIGTRNYTKINTDNIVNTCSVRCRYKPEGGSWSHSSGSGVGVLLWTDTSTDTFDVILPDIVTDTKLSYTVELNIIDDTYLPSAMVFNIPSENIEFNLRDGGKGAAFGKYATEENLLDCAWDAKFNGVSYLNSLYLIEEEITVDGDKDTYYPVHIEPVLLEKYTKINTQPAFLGLGKILDSKAGDWEGNHSTANASSISAGWLYRYSGWDGNGDYIIPLYKREPFAKILAHIQGLNQAAKGVVLYLRGGGATYRIACSIPFNPHVYLAETNVSESSDPALYPVMLTPRGYEGNKGINFSNGIASDFVVEQAQTSTWYYRKWYSGMAECWYRRNVDVNINTAWGSALYYGVASTINYPFTFSEKPICQITCEYGDDETSLFIASCGSGTNVYATPVMLCRTDAKTVNCNILYHVHGRWR